MPNIQKVKWDLSPLPQLRSFKHQANPWSHRCHLHLCNGISEHHSLFVYAKRRRKNV